MLVILIFIELFRIVLILKLFLLGRILLAGAVKAVTSFNTFFLNLKTVSLDSIMVSVVVVLILNLMEVSFLSIIPFGVKLGSSVVVNFRLDYLMLEVLVFGVVVADVDVILLAIMMIVTGKVLDVELT